MVGILKRLFSRTFAVIERAEKIQTETTLLHQRARATLDGENHWFLRVQGEREVPSRTFECREVDDNAE